MNSACDCIAFLIDLIENYNPETENNNGPFSFDEENSFLCDRDIMECKSKCCGFASSNGEDLSTLTGLFEIEVGPEKDILNNLIAVHQASSITIPLYKMIAVIYAETIDMSELASEHEWMFCCSHWKEVDLTRFIGEVDSYSLAVSAIYQADGQIHEAACDGHGHSDFCDIRMIIPCDIPENYLSSKDEILENLMMIPDSICSKMFIKCVEDAEGMDMGDEKEFRGTFATLPYDLSSMCSQLAVSHLMDINCDDVPMFEDCLELSVRQFTDTLLLSHPFFAKRNRAKNAYK